MPPSPCKQAYPSSPVPCPTGASRFVHVSAADFGLIENLIPGYFGGKRAADAEISRLFGDHGAILRPGMIHGTRQVRVRGWKAGRPR